MTGSPAIPFVVPLRRVDAACAMHVGGKAANLAGMRRAGLPVPDGFCVTAAAFSRFLEGGTQYGTLCARLEGLAAEPWEPLRAAAADLRNALEAAPLPPEVEAPILAAWQSLGPNHAYAVRSSGTAEDLPDASFAGQHDTFLNVRGRDALLAAVRRCWVSLFSDRAIAYRMRQGIPQRAAVMAVMVQPMVSAAAAGVAFTADPVTGDAGRIVIEATWGLGEALVSGLVSPDRLVLEKRTLRVIENSVSRKTVAIVPDDAGGVRQQPVPAEQQEQPCLEERVARRLGKLARKAERLFGGPQDVEWALCGGRLFLLQSRPITTRSNWLASETQAAGDRAQREVWSNVGTGEVLPDAITPMSWSVLQPIVHGLFDPILRHGGIEAATERWLGLVAGRVYMSVTRSHEILQYLPGPSLLTLDETFGGHQGPADPASAPQAALLRRWLRWPRVLPFLARVLLHTTDRRCAAFLTQWRKRADELTWADVSRLSDAQLADYIPGYFAQLCRGVGAPAFAAAAIGCLGIGLGCAVAVLHLSRRWLGDADGSLANRLLSGAGGMESAESALDLWRMAAEARQTPSVAAALLEPGPFVAVAKKLAEIPGGREFLNRWQAFMARHGHHTHREMDVAQPRWSETPDYVLDLVRGYLRIGPEGDPLALHAEQHRRRQTLEADCRKRLRNPLKRWLFEFLVHKGQRGLTARENCKSDIVRMIGGLRRALVEAGQRLTQRGTLAVPDDVFFLEVAELTSVLKGDPALDIAALIAARKAAHAHNQSLAPPPVVVGLFDPSTAASPAPNEDATVLRGLAVSPGIVTGRARVVLRADSAERILPGEILVAPSTDPGWTPYFLLAAAVVLDLGGQLSHGSVVAREYGLPAVVNVGCATRRIQTGQLIQVDGHRGVVTVLPV